MWRRLCSSSCRSGRRLAAEALPAFAFDIDGVLLRGGRPLDLAKRALAALYDAHCETPRYPLVFLTNGGGVTEAAKAAELSAHLGVNVQEDQVVLSHTPFRALVGRFGNLPVLASGRKDFAAVAAAYGFRHVATPAALAAADPTAVPFRAATLADSAQAGPRTSGRRLGTEDNPFRAVLVFTDPHDWYLDLQLILDVLTSGGVLGRRLEDTPPGGADVAVHISHQDLLWAADHPVPRLAMGAFGAALEQLYARVTGRPLEVTYYGKPTPAPYRLAERLLAAARSRLQQPSDPPVETGSSRCSATAGGEGSLLGAGSSSGAAAGGGGSCKDSQGEEESRSSPLGRGISAVYAIGDNPAADVAGARQAGPPWVPCLVRTGVWDGRGRNSAEHPADVVVDDVEGAVQAAFHRERARKWHSLA